MIKKRYLAACFLIAAHAVEIIVKYSIKNNLARKYDYIAGLLIVNLFFGVMLIPLKFIAEYLEKSGLFLDCGKLTDVLKFIFLGIGIVCLFFIPFLTMPFDVFVVVLFWLFVYCDVIQ